MAKSSSSYLALAYLFLVATPTLSSPVPVPNKDVQRRPLIQGGEDPDPVIRARRDFVKQMMKDAWDNYVLYAWGDNELKPINRTGNNGGIFPKMGGTIVDSLSSLFIMEMMEEYEMARQWVGAELDFHVDSFGSLFEINIRMIGGLLSAYALTGDSIYRFRAVELARLMLPAFNSTTGIPYSRIKLATGEVEGTNAVLAEYGTLHLEWMYLSEISGDPIFAERVLAIRQFLKEIEKPNGLYPNHLDIHEGHFTDTHVSIGALGDSYYEYLIKAAIQLDDDEAKEMYDDAMDAFVDNDLVQVSNQSHLVYIAEMNGGQIQHRVGHLACFAGGMFALGAYAYPNGANAERDAEIGRNFTNTCHESYIRTQTHIGPEVFEFDEDKEAVAGGPAYILRPEVMESYFVNYRITGDVKYREWAWDAAQAYERYTKVGPGLGYSGIRDTNNPENPGFNDLQETFFLAETLKYLYLIFSTDDLISLDEWVFNTECQPLPIKATNPLF